MSEPEPDDRLLAAIWQHIRSIDADNVQGVGAAGRVIANGANPADVALVMQAGALSAAFQLLYLVAGEHSDPDNPDDGIGWALVEADLADDEVIPRPDRPMDGIFEMLLTSDPTGRDGQDIV
jgi:hypothetical protein